jgi:hypothetical protein
MAKNKVKNGKKVRVTLDLSIEFYDRLEQLERLAGAESKAGLIRDALLLYEQVAIRILKGCKLQAIDPEGKTETFVVLKPFCEAARAAKA